MYVERFFIKGSTESALVRDVEKLADIVPTQDGLLMDLDHPLRRYWPGMKGLRVWQDIESLPCLVLLGEPGQGKTTEWRHQVGIINQSGDDSHKAFLIQLRDLNDTGDLEVQLQPCRNHLAAGAGTQADVFVDSLDEGMLRFGNIDRRLVAQIKAEDLPRDRVRWRIACRPADWPHRLERTLGEHYGEPSVELPRISAENEDNGSSGTVDAVQDHTPSTEQDTPAGSRAIQKADGDSDSSMASWGIVLLCPLREKDVLALAKHAGVGRPEDFIEELNRVEGRPIAANPVTLNALLEVYKDTNRGLPRSKTKLYEEMVDRMAQEWSEERKAAAEYGQHDLAERDKIGQRERRAIAQRIAAVSVFGRRPAISRGSGEAESQRVLTRSDVEGAHVIVNPHQPGHTQQITRDGLKAVLDTRLFTGVAPDIMVFSHRSYADYLAAHAVKGWHLSRLKTLLAHPEDAQRRVVPELRETAAWLAGMHEGVRDWLLAEQPEVLINADPTAISIEMRPLLCDAFFEYLDMPGVQGWGIDNYRVAERLKHPDLGRQLLPFLRGEGNRLQHYRAVGIAEHVSLSDEFYTELADVALDADRPVDIRAYAMVVLERQCENTGICCRLEQFAELSNTSLEGGKLKGAALSMLFPKCWDIEKLIQYLEIPVPIAPTVTGPKYSDFLRFHMEERLQRSDVAPMLCWLVEAIRQTDLRTVSHSDLGPLPACLLLRAWDGLGEGDTIATAAADLIISYAERQLDLWAGSTSFLRGESDPRKVFEVQCHKDDTRRRLLIEQILKRQPEVSDPKRAIGLAMFLHDPYHAIQCTLPRQTDFEWLLDLALGLPFAGKAIAYSWAWELLSSSDPLMSARVDRFVKTVQGDTMRAELESTFFAVPIDSQAAKQWRRKQDDEKKRREGEHHKARAVEEAVLRLADRSKPADSGALMSLVDSLAHYKEQRDSPSWTGMQRTWAELAAGRQAIVLDSIEAYFVASEPESAAVVCIPRTCLEFYQAFAFRWLVLNRPSPESWTDYVWSRWMAYAIRENWFDHTGEWLGAIWAKKSQVVEEAAEDHVKRWLSHHLTPSDTEISGPAQQRGTQGPEETLADGPRLAKEVEELLREPLGRNRHGPPPSAYVKRSC